jgi:DUF2917 family protein
MLESDEARWQDKVMQFLRRHPRRHPVLDLELEQERTWSRVVGRRGIEVYCTLGLVVITCEGDREDHVLSGGAAFVTSRPGRLAIWALHRTRLRMQELSRRADGAPPKAQGGLQCH